MKIKFNHQGDQINDVWVWLTNDEMDKFGRKQELCVENLFGVDSHMPKDGAYETMITLGTFGGKKPCIVYHVTVKRSKIHPENCFVEYELLTKHMHGSDERVSMSHVKKYEFYCKFTQRRNTLEKFIRKLIKDGHMNFFTK